MSPSPSLAVFFLQVWTIPVKCPFFLRFSFFTSPRRPSALGCFSPVRAKSKAFLPSLFFRPSSFPAALQGTAFWFPLYPLLFSFVRAALFFFFIFFYFALFLFDLGEKNCGIFSPPSPDFMDFFPPLLSPVPSPRPPHPSRGNGRGVFRLFNAEVGSFPPLSSTTLFLCFLYVSKDQGPLPVSFFFFLLVGRVFPPFPFFFSVEPFSRTTLPPLFFKIREL